MEEKNEIINLENINILKAFSDDDSIETIISNTRDVVVNFKHDMSTDSGRKRTASFSNKIAKLKVKLDNVGKDLVSEWKEKSKAVDKNRKRIRDELDLLKIEARKPLTELENIEKARISDLECRLDQLIILGQQLEIYDLSTLRSNLEKANNMDMGDSWQEFKCKAIVQRELVINNLVLAINKEEKRAQEMKELAELRKKEEERKQSEYDEKIRLEAEAKATKEQEKKYLDKIEKEKKKAIADYKARELDHYNKIMKEENDAKEIESIEKNEVITDAEFSCNPAPDPCSQINECTFTMEEKLIVMDALERKLDYEIDLISNNHDLGSENMSKLIFTLETKYEAIFSKIDSITINN